MDWRPLSALLDFSGRSHLHSGRPAIEQVPALDFCRLRRAGAADGVVLDLRAFDGPLAVTVLARATFRPDGGQVTLTWERTPEIGSPTTETQVVELEASPTGTSGFRYYACCPSCGGSAARLLWAVTQFACKRCVGLRSETVRLRKTYSRQKFSRMAREELGVSLVPLSPVAVKSKKHFALAERLFEVEREMIAEAALKDIR